VTLAWGYASNSWPHPIPASHCSRTGTSVFSRSVLSSVPRSTHRVHLGKLSWNLFTHICRQSKSPVDKCVVLQPYHGTDWCCNRWCLRLARVRPVSFVLFEFRPTSIHPIPSIRRWLCVKCLQMIKICLQQRAGVRTIQQDWNHACLVYPELCIKWHVLLRPHPGQGSRGRSRNVFEKPLVGLLSYSQC